MRKIIGNLFPRKRYIGGSTAKYYAPPERLKLQKILGGASKIYLHSRVYDRASSNSPAATFSFSHGCFGDESPSESLRAFTISPSTTTPNLPYDSTSMSSLPDDGYVVLTPAMGLLDSALVISGSGNCWVEMEVWFTAEID
jgi:hypothetical protein